MSELSISAIAEINPSSRVPAGLQKNDLVSFIPMGDVSEDGQWPSRQTRSLGSLGSGFAVFTEGDVLVAKITPCMENGKGVHAVGLVNGVGFGSTEFHVLRAKPGVSPGFVFQLTKWKKFRQEAESAMVGSAGQKRVQRGFFDSFQVPRFDGEEQRRITKVLDTLDTAIHQTEALIAKLKAVKQGLLHDLLTRGIDANGELRPPRSKAPDLYKQTPRGWIPKSWCFKPLVEMIDFPEGQVDPQRFPFRDWILVAPDHIESGSGRLLQSVTASEQRAISGKYVYEAGDVLYSKIRPYLKKAILAEGRGLCSADMYPLRPRDGLKSRYLLSVILGADFSMFAESVSMRSGFPKINRSEMSEFSLGWPDEKEQEAIVHIIMDFDERQSSTEAELEKLRRIKVALMDDLLTGRVRVNPLLDAATA
ncbi:restriction endonuclease subunit S [Xanthomonas sacchari]|uniref:restriction endonuclease subunit S n=1 Tax=Xanthomonas sacchari TaxID=56458 RepID=UPI0022552CD8|nr:restriction endonuclease subunit S [Xanthomonas sacchari]MCW0370941.1 hypothetical protein [Xanthomonas sacchari]